MEPGNLPDQVPALPAALDTLNELAAALGNDPNFATTVMNALAGKQPLDTTLTNLSGKSISGLLEYLGLTEITTVKGATDSFPYFSGPNSARLTTLTEFARNLLSKPDDIDVRNALKLGTAATKKVGNGSGQLPDMSFFSRSIEGNGYFLLPNGVVIQWGRVTISGSTAAHITYPIPFPNNRLVLAASPVGSDFTINPATPVFTDGDRFGCDVRSWGTSNYTAMYIAIGG